MSDLKQKIRKLIDKSKESGDPDLLDLAMDLLDQIPADPPELQMQKAAVKQGEDFAMNSATKISKPVSVEQRQNKFVDDGTEHKDEANKTPEIKATERRRPTFKKVDQTCTRCSKSVEVHPQHAREFYVCDRCLRR